MSWQQDVADIREYEAKGGTRHLALLYARVVAQIGHAKCAAEVGCSTTTTRRYTKTWDMLAEKLDIVHVKDLAPDTDYDFDAVGLTQEVWDETYEAMRYTLKSGQKISKRQPGTAEVIAAIEGDPVKELAVRESLEKIDTRRKLAKARNQATDPKPTAPGIDVLEDWMGAVRKVNHALADLLGQTTELPSDAESREIVTTALAELRGRATRYFDAVADLTAGKSMDDELVELLGGVE